MKSDNTPVNLEGIAADLDEECRKAAEDIRDTARQLAPMRTGNLRRGIQVHKIDDAEYAVGWTDDAFYGRMVEFGTEDTRPKPHLVPAVTKNGGK